MQQRIRSGTRLRRVPADAFCVVKSVIAGGATVLIVASLIAGNVYADRPVRQVSPQRRQKRSSSLLPVHSFQNASKFLVSGPATYSPLRVIDRKEIDQTGRPTTAAAVANEPSVRILWRLTPGPDHTCVGNRHLRHAPASRVGDGTLAIFPRNGLAGNASPVALELCDQTSINSCRRHSQR